MPHPVDMAIAQWNFCGATSKFCGSSLLEPQNTAHTLKHDPVTDNLAISRFRA